MKILMAVSGAQEESGADLIDAVLAVPWGEDTEFRVLTVAELLRPQVVEMVPATLDFVAMQEDIDVSAADTADTADTAASRLRFRGLAADSLSLVGAPESVISRHAKDWDADIVVVGASGRSALERFFVGSVSRGVVKHAPCSVLVVKPPAREHAVHLPHEPGTIAPAA